MSEQNKITSLCLECEHFSGKSRPVAKKNNGQSAVWEGSSNWCKKYDKDLLLIEHKEHGMIPDVAECESFKQK
jgi:hypothetical protein